MYCWETPDIFSQTQKKPAHSDPIYYEKIEKDPTPHPKKQKNKKLKVLLEAGGLKKECEFMQVSQVWHKSLETPTW